jgi:predicted LPLAT superfamily acyltransferase
MSNPPAWDGKSKGSIAGTWIFIQLIARFGLFPAYVLLVFVSLHYALFKKEPIAAIRSLRGHLHLKTSMFDLYRHFFSFGMSLIDKYAFLLRGKSPFSLESIREDVIAQALGNGRGVILLGAHIGNWEIAGNLLSKRINAPDHFVMVDAETSAMRALFKKAFDSRKTFIIPIGADGFDLMFSVRDALKKNGIVCMHGDRSTGSKGQKHNFLGEDVTFPLGPFAIGAATGAPIVPIMVTKSGLRKYVFKAYAPILFEGITPENRDKYIFTAMERYVGILEQVVKEKPYEWFNFYTFWANETNS